MNRKKTQYTWRALPYEEWNDTLDTLHMYMQVAGKVKLTLCPFLNQWWEVAFHVTASGMTTGLIPYENRLFEINFDFISHNVFICTNDNETKTISLMPRSVADFYKEFMKTLNALGITVKINTLPSEVPNPIRCDEDTERASYDKEYVHRWWRILVQLCPIFEKFRSPFRGKSSPVQFFWGSFDLSETRFSGKPAEPPKTGGRIMRFSENEENFACGFWAGNAAYPYPALYSYIYPPPVGIESVRLKPDFAVYDPKLAIFLLPYEDVRQKADADELIMDFLQSSYSESAKLAGWNIKSLEGPVPKLKKMRIQK